MFRPKACPWASFFPFSPEGGAFCAKAWYTGTNHSRPAEPAPPGSKKGGIPLRKAFSITGLVLGIAAAAASAAAIVFSSIGLHRQ